MPIGEQPPSAEIASQETKDPAIYWIIAFFIFCVWLLFSNLPGAALFEPDEGRNAEIAREILLLKDWVTPHYDFIPRLDKPVLFFDVVALSYKLFGISEWSSRLSSALAALGLPFLNLFFVPHMVRAFSRPLERLDFADERRVFCSFADRDFGHAPHFLFDPSALLLCLGPVPSRSR